jgi:hypothetical protein
MTDSFRDFTSKIVGKVKKEHGEVDYPLGKWLIQASELTKEAAYKCAYGGDCSGELSALLALCVLIIEQHGLVRPGIAHILERVHHDSFTLDDILKEIEKEVEYQLEHNLYSNVKLSQGSILVAIRILLNEAEYYFTIKDSIYFTLDRIRTVTGIIVRNIRN